MNETEINQADSLVIIEKLVAKCQRCDLYRTKTKDVPGVGNEHAGVMFIGEGPGKDEDLQGEPFVGAAGKFLTEMILSQNMKRADVYIANVIKHRPPNNRDPLPDEIEACWRYLRRQIELIQPKLIVFLGRHAMNRFFPEMQISKVHGQAFRKDFNGKKQVFLALYHPAAALYNGSMRQTLMADFAKIPKILKKIDLESHPDEGEGSQDSSVSSQNGNNDNNHPIKQDKLF